MERRMKLEVWLAKNGGAKMDVDITFKAKSRAELARTIQAAEDEIAYYMVTGDSKKESCFVFGDFILRKSGIQAIRLSEADY